MDVYKTSVEQFGEFTRFHLDLVANFDVNTKANNEHVSELSCMINQLKAALVIRGMGLSRFNILSREMTETLENFWSGSTGSTSDFLNVFQSLFPESCDSSCNQTSAVKVHLEFQGRIHSVILSVLFGTTISDISSKLRLSRDCIFVTQGINLLPETPIEFLQNNCVYADGFVHLVVKYVY